MARQRDVTVPRAWQEHSRPKPEKVPGPGPPSKFASDRNPVTAFLREAGLIQYARVLNHHGFDDMETLLCMEDEHMREMGIATGHILKLKRHLREHALQRFGQREPASQSSQIAVPRFGGGETQGKAYTSVQLSWMKLKDEIGLSTVGGLFYQKFFALEPEAKELFPLSMRFRYMDWGSSEEEDPDDPTHSPALRNLWAKFISVVGSAVAGLQDTCRLVPMLQQLGIRHAGYGLKESYFHLAGKILVDCISEGLGKSFTKEVENAWVMVSGFMVATMLSGFSTAQKDIQDAEERLRLSLHPSDAESTALGETELETDLDSRQITPEDLDVYRQ